MSWNFSSFFILSIFDRANFLSRTDHFRAYLGKNYRSNSHYSFGTSSRLQNLCYRVTIFSLNRFTCEILLLILSSFSNGSLLIAALQPRFVILHNLSTSRGPSPIITLAWHASSSRQKSDMLATQTKDGDLRVWSVAKSPTSNDTAKVVRVLKRTNGPENYQPGPNWLGWSKNGRIVQYSEG